MTTWTIHAGRHRLTVPRAWDAFVFCGRRYRVHGHIVEVCSPAGTWAPSLRLTISAPKGRVTA